MDFSRFLKENSLFVGAGARGQLVEDIESVMNSLIFNYFGFLGLVKLNNKAGYLKTYEKSDKAVSNVNNVGDDSTDVSLSLKLALDAGALKQATVMKMNKLLLAIRQKKVTSENLDDMQVRSILDEIKYSTYKPSTRVLQVLKDFHSGTISLAIMAKKLYILSKASDFASATVEFRDLVVKGQFIKLFSSLSDKELDSDKAPAQPAKTAETSTKKEPDAFFFKKP